MPVVTRRELLEAGVHFGHQTRRWNPKMQRFIFGERSGIYIIDLEKSLSGSRSAHAFVRDLGRRRGIVLFIGTKKQAQEVVAEQAGAGRHALREQPLAGRHAHELPRRSTGACSACGSCARWSETGAMDYLPEEGGASGSATSRTSSSATSPASRTWSGCPTPSS